MKLILEGVVETLKENKEIKTEATSKYRSAPDVRVELPYKEGQPIQIDFSSGKLLVNADKFYPDNTDDEWKTRKAAEKVATDIVIKAFEKALEDIAKSVSKKGIKS
uniref:Uncharacterized protein n=1 Tax=Rhizobium phage LG08 TaxID=3129229 RepID=A0AAU8HYB4_9CAUD